MTLFLTGTGPSVPPASDGEVTSGVRSGALPVEMVLYSIGGGIPGFSSTEIPLEVRFHGPAPALVSGVEVIQVRASLAAYIVRMRSSRGELFEDSGYINFRIPLHP